MRYGVGVSMLSLWGSKGDPAFQCVRRLRRCTSNLGLGFAGPQREPFNLASSGVGLVPTGGVLRRFVEARWTRILYTCVPNTVRDTQESRPVMLVLSSKCFRPPLSLFVKTACYWLNARWTRILHTCVPNTVRHTQELRPVMLGLSLDFC